MILPKLFVQQQLTFIVLQLNIFWKLLKRWKCLPSNCRNFLVTLVETLRLNGGLNHMMFRRPFCFVLYVISGWYFRLMLLQPLCFSAFSYSPLDLLKTSLLEKFFSCFIICGGWFELFLCIAMNHLVFYKVWPYHRLNWTLCRGN